MKIIIAVNGNELCNTLSSLDVPQKGCFDEGSRFICGDLAGRRVRHKRAARSFVEFKANFEDMVKFFSSESENESRPESLSKDCKPAPLSASETSEKNGIFYAVLHRNKENAAHLSDEECLKVAVILKLFCGSNISDCKKILDFSNVMLDCCNTSSDFEVKESRKKTNLDNAIRCSVQACRLRVPDKLE